MADNAPEKMMSTIGFEVAGGIKSLQALGMALEDYRKALVSVASTSAAFNKGVDQSALTKMQQSLNGQASALKKQEDQIIKSYKNREKIVKEYAQRVQKTEQAYALQRGFPVNQYKDSTKDLSNYLKNELGMAKLQKQAIAQIQKQMQTEDWLKGGKTAASSRTKIGLLSDIEKQAINQFGATYSRVAKKAAEDTKPLLLGWQSLARIFAIQVFHQAISALTYQFYSGVRAASDYEIKLAEIQTVSKGYSASLQAVGADVRRLSEAYGEQLEIVSKGVYEQLSNQIGDAAEVTSFMTDAMDFGAAAVTNTGDSVDLLSSTLNSFNLSMYASSNIAGKLFKTIELGRIRGEEFANTFGRVSVLAAQLGQSLDELLASIATLTLSGLRYNEAFTLISNLQLKMINPTEKLTGRYKELGLASGEAGVAAYGFQGLIAKIGEDTNGTASELGEFFNRIRAIRGAIGLSNGEASKYAENLRQIQEASRTDLYKAKAFIFETNAKQVQIEMARLRAFFVDDMGRDVLATTRYIFEALGGATNTMKTLTEVVVVSGTAWLLWGRNVQIASLSLTGITKFAKANWLALIVAGLGAAATAWDTYRRKTRDALEAQIAFKEASAETLAKAQSELVQDRVNKALDVFKGQARTVMLDLQKVQAELNKQMPGIVATQKAVFEGWEDQLKAKVSAYEDYVKAIREVAKETRKALKEADVEIKNIRQKQGDVAFNRSLRGLSEYDRVIASMNRVEQLRLQSARLLNTGEKPDQDRAVDLMKQAEALNEQATSQAENLNNTELLAKVDYQMNQLLQEQINFQERLKALAEEKARLAKLAQGEEESRLTRIKAIMIQIGDFKIIKDNELLPKKERDKAVNTIRELTGSLQTELKNASRNMSLADILNAKEFLIEANKPTVSPLTGETQMKIGAAIEQDMNSIVSKVQDYFYKLPEKSRELLLKLKFDPDEMSINDMQNRLVQMMQGVTASANKAPDLAMAKKHAADLVTKIMDTQNLAAEQLVKYRGYWDTVRWPFGENTNTPESKLNISKLQSKASMLIDAGMSANASPEELAKYIKVLTDFGSEVSGQGYTEAATSIKNLVAAFQELYETQQRIKQISEGTDMAAGLRDSDTIMEMFQQSGIAATSAADVIVQQQSRIGQAIHNNINLLREFNLLQGGGDLQPTKGERYGGMIYRALGGFIPRGFDRRLVAMDPAEFVVNASASRRFHSQLVAMNAGIQPNFKRFGGSVTNVGDISISVNESSSPRQTAREVMSAVKRELRRGSASL